MWPNTGGVFAEQIQLRILKWGIYPGLFTLTFSVITSVLMPFVQERGGKGEGMLIERQRQARDTGSH